jgi:hypothetical protein
LDPDSEVWAFVSERPLANTDILGKEQRGSARQLPTLSHPKYLSSISSRVPKRMPGACIELLCSHPHMVLLSRLVNETKHKYTNRISCTSAR